MTHDLEFQPKEGGETWTADVNPADGSGYDVVLFLDKKAATPDSGWMLELGISPDGTVAGQITAHPGYDALAVFQCTQEHITVHAASSNRPAFRIGQGNPTATHRIAPAPNALIASLRNQLQAIMDHDKGLNDPNGDGSGDGAQSPTGDDYNEVCGLLQPIYDALGIVGPCSPYSERNPA